MAGSLGGHHAGELPRAAAEARAEQITAEGLGKHSWQEGDLASARKSDPIKLEIAARLRRETTLTIKAIACRLHLGTSKGANTNLHRHMRLRGSSFVPGQVQLGI